MGGRKRSQPPRLFFQGTIWFVIKDRRALTKPSQADGEAHRLGRKKIRMAVDERREQNAKKFRPRNPEGSILEKTLNSIKIWAGPCLALKANSLLNLKSYFLTGVLTRASQRRKRRGLMKKKEK